MLGVAVRRVWQEGHSEEVRVVDRWPGDSGIYDHVESSTTNLLKTSWRQILQYSRVRLPLDK